MQRFRKPLDTVELQRSFASLRMTPEWVLAADHRQLATDHWLLGLQFPLKVILDHGE